MRRVHLFQALCVWRKGSYSMQEPHYADVDAKLVAKYLKDARDDAAFQFDAYVFKLVKKIGPASTAQLELIDGLWSNSILSVTVIRDTPTGSEWTTERWSTKHIVNQSKLGKVFSQFPTRLMK